MLLLHFTNHYTLIYAYREYKHGSTSTSASSSTALIEVDTHIHREVLCARRGQRPTAWIDFSELRQVLLKWEGYKVIRITRVPSALSDSPPTDNTDIDSLIINMREGVSGPQSLLPPPPSPITITITTTTTVRPPLLSLSQRLAARVSEDRDDPVYARILSLLNDTSHI